LLRLGPETVGLPWVVDETKAKHLAKPENRVTCVDANEEHWPLDFPNLRHPLPATRRYIPP
jgi:hypothetical protein